MDTKAARTRKRLLDAAAVILADRGYAGTRLADIADEAGLRATAIYYHYGSREELVEEVMHAGAARMTTRLRAALDALPDNATPSKRIDVAVAAHLREDLELSNYAKAITRNANQLPDAIGARARAEIAAYNGIWRTLIADLAAADLLRPGLDPDVARMVVLGALNWAVEWYDPARGSIEVLIDTTRSMVLHALRP